MTDDIALFHASVGERFRFLARRGFTVAKRTSIGDRYGAISFKGPNGEELAISWDAYDGGLEATMDGRNVWEMLLASGDWGKPGYQGFAVEAMQHGLDRIALYLSAHPDVMNVRSVTRSHTKSGFSRLADYDDLPVFVADDPASFISAASRGDVKQGLSVAFVLGTETATIIEAAAAVAADLAPVLVHCFGQDSERAHDIVDAVLIERNKAALTYWSEDVDPPNVIFELFCTDLPAESDFDRWSGRLLILSTSLDSRTKQGFVNGLRDIGAAVQEALRSE